jgi:glycosyltransferase involved in cell wall biosynthesis
VISIICPCYNEADVIEEFVRRLSSVLSKNISAYELVCVNDGSTDSTLPKLLALQKEPLALRIIDLSRRFGKEAALAAGLDHANGEAVIIIDADLQDPPELIPQLVASWQDGNKVVVARRVDRSSDTLMKRQSARAFYRLHNLISDTAIPLDVGDFRLMDREVVDVLCKLPERQRFMKGLFSWVGFDYAVVDYVREKRASGQTKFNWWHLWNLGLEGITSFSTAPLRIWTYVGLAISTAAFLYGGYIFARTIVFGVDVPGYASLLIAILFIGGVQLISLGVIGEYIGRIYMESKGRPIYVVRREL